jgi:hypothetical protein
MRQSLRLFVNLGFPSSASARIKSGSVIKAEVIRLVNKKSKAIKQ